MAPSSVFRSTPAKVLGLGALAGAACLGYAAGIEVRNFTVRHLEVPCLQPGADPIRVLHVSDLHVTPNQQSKLRWIASLAALEPDLVVNTGDNLAHLDSVGPLLDAFGPLLDVPGVFVLGSNDYFAPKARNPLWYLMPDDGKRNTSTPQLRWKELKLELSQGWLDLTNTTGSVEVNGSTIAFAGVDDPHLEYDDLAEVAGPAPAWADLRMGVAHAPYLRVLDQFAADGYDLTLAGHTHGGQVCLPFKGAIVTNCDLEPARAKGLHRHPADSRPGDPGSSWLHVSAGAGTSPYAQFRFFCRPEASLLTLVPSSR
ncbi:metallophosphoesterase [Nocardioides marmorisolisilvae]|uniref:Metallophosphoesterase n=1 Tax=Nocardioides marmorisolisilvae TaxID=1542737 RepID=A0A3N0E0F7_9ACTN|nr:metallophosphoesterase [Nocardioides marmorisolisilvae]RNL81315.1 metallophosphoesterase [Nocardioides marmorisolisilvae]